MKNVKQFKNRGAVLHDMQLTFYSELDPRRRLEKAQGRMVKEDPQAMANLSPKFIHREYPSSYDNPFFYVFGDESDSHE